MKIYTGRGDEGMTDLRDMSRVSKTSPRIEAYGTVDEVNSLIGLTRPSGYDDVDERLEAIQNHLHIIQADFANPDADDADAPHIEQHHVEKLEGWMDEFDEELEPLRSFILPGGSDVGASSTTPGRCVDAPSAGRSRWPPTNRSTTPRSRISTDFRTGSSSSPAS